MWRMFVAAAFVMMFKVTCGFRERVDRLDGWEEQRLVASGQTNRTGEGRGTMLTADGARCMCGDRDNEWDAYCFCPRDPSCIWDDEPNCHGREDPNSEEGYSDELVPDDATAEYESGGRGVSGDPHYVVGRFPIVSQNSLNVGEGAHACWAVTRSVNSKWAGLLGSKGPKKYANELYTAPPADGHTGWFIPTKGVCYLNGHYQRVFLDSDKFTVDNVGHWVQSQIRSGKTIAVSMSNRDCRSTFHYVTIIGVMPAIEGKVRKVLVMDPWCPEYKEGPGYYTVQNTMSLGRYDNGRVEHSVMSHPCVRVAEITDFQRRARVKSEGAGSPVGMMYLDNLNYATGPRCTYKMWVVCHKNDMPCKDTYRPQ